MIELYAFIAGSPWVSFFLAWLLLHLIVKIMNIFIVRPLRVINIWLNGWPPPHLDADGDWKPEEES